MTETLPALDTPRAVSWPAIKSMILRHAGDRRPKIGTMVCPRCEKATLYYCITRDGTVSASCAGDNCVQAEPPSASITPALPMSWSARSAPKEEA